MKIYSPIACILLFTWIAGVTTGAAQKPEAIQPPAAKVVASDIALFWHAWDVWQERDHGDPKQLAAVLQAEYLDKGSAGVRGFIPERIVSAQNLAATILKDESYYLTERPVTERLAVETDKLQAPLQELRQILPEAREPTVYLVIGARNSGGTSTDAGLILGAEMFSPKADSRLHPDDLWPLAVHELIHYQQKTEGQTLLIQSLKEGAADFFAERLMGRDTDEGLKTYGDAHEQDLWQSFYAARNGDNLSAWLYNGSSVQFKGTGRPPDLGYYMGYKICQSYYEWHADKVEALRTLLVLRDPIKIVAESGYAKRFR